MENEVQSTCCYCGVGCGVLIQRDGDKIVGVRGDPSHPANQGRLCTKGASLAKTTDATWRLKTPELRPVRGRTGQRLSWRAALDHAAERFAGIIRDHGPDAVAFYISGQLLTEDYYVFNKLAKGLIGTNNIDTNSRLCMSSAVAGYKATLGADAPPACYEDIDHADLIIIAGANPAVAHPIVFRRIEDAKLANPDLRIVVIDPRRTETAELADLHLAIEPGSDIALFNAVLNELVRQERIDRDYIAAHTEGWDALLASIAADTPDSAAQQCGIDASKIVQLATWLGESRAALSLYCQGLNQSAQGTHKNAALIHLHLATGQIGRPGAGPFSLTGQPNAMGGREVGGMATLLSAHRDLANPAHRAEVAALWGIPEVPAKPGLAAVDLFKAAARGEIKALWIACTNPAQSLPNQAEVRAALDAVDFVVVQEAFADTDTLAYADLVLPATTWGEKCGTVTNSERRISRVQGVVPPPGEARADWAIAVDFARHLGARLGHPATDRLFPYASVEAVFNEHRESTRGRDLDITGLSYALLETEGPQQWPYPEGAVSGQARLYGDGRFPTANGRARFIPLVPAGSAEQPDAETPFRLMSGRMRDHWHDMSRTGTTPRLFNLEDEPCLSMHPLDLPEIGLMDGAIARVRNARGMATLRVQASDRIQRGQAWVPMHWGSQFMNSAGANALATDAVDPYSKQPELKHAAVAIEAAGLTYPVAGLRRCDSAEAARASLHALRRLFPEWGHATVGLYGRRHPVVVFRGAMAEPVSASMLARLDAALGLGDDAESLSFIDARQNVSKRAHTREGALVAVRLAGETSALAWLREALAEDALPRNLMRFALAPGVNPPKARPARCVICKCADVSAEDIDAVLAAGGDLPQLQDTLRCGTFCGGCVPDLKRRVAEYAPPQAVAA